MTAFHGHRTFSGHARMADDVAALHGRQTEALGNLPRQPHALEDLDTLSGAHDAHGGRQLRQCSTHRGFFCLNLQYHGAGVLKPVQWCIQSALQRRDQRLEIILFGGGLQGQLDPALRHFIAINGKPGAVRPAVRHSLEHRFEQPAEL